MKIAPKLKDLGLNKSEIKVYLYLLEHGVATPPQIAKGTGITRTNTYHLLRSLTDQDLLIEQKQRKRKAYLAADPDALIRRVERRKETIERLLPDLRGIYSIQKNKPKIRYYDDFEQVKDIYEQLLNTKDKRTYGIASTKKLFKLSPGFFKKFRQQLRERNIELLDIELISKIPTE